MNEMLRRQEALNKTLVKYRNRPLDFKTADCVRAARFHLVQMGHKPPPMPRYRSLIGAVRAAEKVGGLEALLDGLLPRIAPAAMWLGDIALLEGDGGLDAIVFNVGHKLAGWHQDAERMVNMTAPSVKGAWRV